MAGGVEITGEVGFDWYGECRRCLDEIHGHHDVDVPRGRPARARRRRDPPHRGRPARPRTARPGAGPVRAAHRPAVRATTAPVPTPTASPPPPRTEHEAAAAPSRRREAPPPDPRWAALDELRLRHAERRFDPGVGPAIGCPVRVSAPFAPAHQTYLHSEDHRTMAVPKRKTSKAKGRSRRAANWKLERPSRSLCPRCGVAKVPARRVPQLWLVPRPPGRRRRLEPDSVRFSEVPRLRLGTSDQSWRVRA